jgi:hypothetical protein
MRTFKILVIYQTVFDLSLLRLRSGVQHFRVVVVVSGHNLCVKGIIYLPLLTPLHFQLKFEIKYYDFKIVKFYRD